MAGKRVAKKEVSEFIKRCMRSVGTPDEHAASLADILITADYRGHFSHGLNRLGKIIDLAHAACILPHLVCH